MKKIFRFTIPFIAAFLLLGAIYYLAAAFSQSPDGVIIVTTLQDERVDDGYCSLREAIQAANTNVAVDTCSAGDAELNDTILFTVVGTITVTDKLSLTVGGPLVIDGGDVITVTGGMYHVIWQVESGSVVTLDHMITVNGYTSNSSENLTIADSKFLEYASLIHNLGNMVIVNSTFYKNYGTYEGGSILNEGSMTITNTSFIEDSMSWMGIGSAIFNKGTMIVADSSFLNNQNTAIFNENSLTIINSKFQGNSPSGVVNDGDITIIDSTFSGNYGYEGGAGFYNWGVATVTNSSFSGNTATTQRSRGGGIWNSGVLTLTGSTFSGNSVSAYGGGIFNEGISTITNSTFSGNSANSYGGGIYNVGVITITNTTISDNSAPSISGRFNRGKTTFSNAIIANSISGNNCQPYPGPVITDAGHNLASDGTCSLDPANGSLPDTDPKLSPLQDNGGPTLTYALLIGSPAIDAGDNVQCPHTDQRGIHRPWDGDQDGLSVCDIGSFELVVPVYFQNPRYLPMAFKAP